MTSDDASPTPSEMARTLFAARAAIASDAGADIHRLCMRVSSNLREAIGADASDALLSRALSRTQFEHPALKDLRPLTGNGVRFEAIPESVQRHGTAVVTSAVEALLTALIEVLSSLIGADMVLNLLSLERPLPPAPDSGPRS